MSKTSIVAEPNNQYIVISRIFEAPQELVFKLWTDATHLPEWWGPSYMTTIVDRLEPIKGGIWRYVHRDPEGNEYAHNGVFHAVNTPEQLIHTYEFEAIPSVGLVTVTFEELPGGRTQLTESTLYPSVEIRDSVLQSGMSEGVIELMDRFATLLDKHSS